MGAMTDRELTRKIYREAVQVTNAYKSGVTRAMRAVSHDLGLRTPAKFAHYDILCELYHEGDLAPSDVAASVGVALPNVVVSLNELCELGLVRRESDPADRRRSVVGLTKLGRRFSDEIVEKYHKTSSMVLPSREAAERLLAGLEEYRAFIEHDTGDAS